MVARHGCMDGARGGQGSSERGREEEAEMMQRSAVPPKSKWINDQCIGWTTRADGGGLVPALTLFPPSQ